MIVGMRRWLVGLVAVGVIAWASAGVRAQDDVAHYISVDDFQLMRAGLITPVHEYVRITPVADGPDRIEVGYQHVGTSSYRMIDFIAWSLADDPSARDPAILGRMDLANQRRIGLSGRALIEAGALVWTADEQYAVAAFRGPPGVEPRPSPFLGNRTQARLQTGKAGVADGGDLITALGEGFTISAGGQRHSYRRVDPRIVQLAGFLSWSVELSVVQTRACMEEIAQAYLDDRPYAFNAATLAEAAEVMAETPGWQIVEERGAGVALVQFLDAALEAQAALNALLAAEVDAVGFMSLLEDGVGLEEDWASRMRFAERIIEGMHILPGDDQFPDALDGVGFADLIDDAVAAYETDPCSETGPFVNAFAGGWASSVLWIVQIECRPRD